MGSKAQGMGSYRSLRNLFFLTSLLLLNLFSPILLAQQSYHELIKELELTEEQRLKIGELKGIYLEKLELLKGEAIKRRIEIRRCLNSPEIDRSRIIRLEMELRDIERQREELLKAYRRDMERILTKDQMERYDNFCDKHERRPKWSNFMKYKHGR